MSQSIDSPLVVLFEDRPKQSMVFQLNLNVYIDARVVVATSMKDLKKALDEPGGVQLVVARAQYKDSPILPKLLKFFEENKVPVPLIGLGDGKEHPGLVLVSAESEVRPLLQAAAKILGITAQQMVSKPRPEKYEIFASFLNLLFTFPCDIYDRKAGTLVKAFNAGDTVPRGKIARLVQENRSFEIDSVDRLKLANAVTEQSLKATEDLENPELPTGKKMALLSASMEMIAGQFQNAGMDEETVKLANASIKAMEKIAESATDMGNLIKQLMEAKGGYRFSHCQIITFLAFHVIKMMNWWGDDQRAVLSQAAFYHDISLSTDEQARIRNLGSLAKSPLRDAPFEELVLSHAQLAARELQTSADLSPEVIRVVIQHHGSPVGRGFDSEISKFDNLSKTFILSEEWCDYLMELGETDTLADNSAQLKKLKVIYKDPQCEQILETFRYLDAKEFAFDFLAATEVELAASLNSSETTESEAESMVVNPSGSQDGAPAKAVKQEKPKKSLAARKMREPKLVDMTKVQGAAGEKARSLLAVIKAKKPEATPEEVEIMLKKGGVVLDPDSVKVIAESHEIEENLIESTLAEEESEQKIEGVTQHIEDEKINVKGARREAEAKQKFESVTDHIEDEEINVKGNRGEAEAKRTIKGVTEHVEEEEINVIDSLREVEAEQTIEGVTELIQDKIFVIKGDKAKELIDRSITRIKADPKEKEREMKMKALSGSTDLMKAALGGAIEKIAEFLAAPNNSSELRKTDAEGRTAIHYAAMGGSVPTLKALIEKGAPLNTADAKRRSPLFFAALYKHNDAFDFLLAQGSKINQQAMGGMTIAMIGAFSGNLHILKAAMERGVRPEAKDHNGKTALDLAKQAKQTETISYLEGLKPNPS